MDIAGLVSPVFILAQDAEQSGSSAVSGRAMQLFEDYGIPAITVLVIILIAMLVGSWASRIVKASCDRARIDETLGKFFAKATRWVVLLIAGLFCLEKFGIETASISVIMGAMGLAIGLAFQGTLSNFSAGIMLLVFRPFKVGDAVCVAGMTGKVDAIDLFTTTFDTPDNRRLVVPNGAIFGSTIENITFHPKRRVDVAVGVEYPADLDKTREVLTAAAQSIEGRLTDEDVAIVLGDLGDSAVNWSVRVWVNTADFWDVKQALTRAVKRHLDEAGLGIPFPQMDVHMIKQEA